MFVPYVLLLFKHADTVLLLKRGNVSFGKGFYALPGGHVDGNETARQAAVREAYEELGITIDQDQLEFVHLFHRQGKNEEIFAIVFLIKKWEGEIINKEPEKHDEIGWFSVNNLPEMLPAHKQAVDLIQDKIFYSEHGWKL